MRFADIPGLKDVKQMLIEAVQHNHIAHAQLFLGAPGALNLPLALAYVTYLHCENKEEDSCGTCAACSKNSKFIHPDTHFVYPFNNVKNDKDEERFRAELAKQWRSFLIEQPFGKLDEWQNYYGGEDKQALISREESREIVKKLSLKPFESRYKIMVIWQPEFMHPGAANGILKILEEPPPFTYFILVTNAADRLLPTIISRTQIVTVPLLQDEEVVNFLQDKKEIESKSASRIAQLADGDLSFALQLTEKEEDDHSGIFAEWMRACFKNNFSFMVGFADEFHGLDRLKQRNILSYSINIMRETLLYLADANTINRTRGEELTFIQNFSKVMKLEIVEESYTLMNDAWYHLERNGSAKMIVLDLSLKLSKSFKE
jgi:DNA polymerase III subunit delta'